VTPTRAPVTSGPLPADLRDMTAPSTLARTAVHVAARSRAIGPTTALWHAVEVHRPAAEVDGACELTLCGSLARISTEQPWPVAARDVCPACLTLAR
jgi:hypothetical protein